MQRKHKSWRDKLPGAVLEYLDVYREIGAVSLIPAGDLATVLKDSEAGFKKKTRRLPELPEDTEMRTLTLDRYGIALTDTLGFEAGSFVLGDNLVPAGLAEALEIALVAAKFLDDPKQRAAACLGLALLYKQIRGIVVGMKQAKYGDSPLDAEKMGVVAAMFFAFLAKLGRGKLELPKGKPNTDLIYLVNLIRRHQKEQLSPKELHAVVSYAGLYRDDSEAFRVWLHRETKKSRVNKAANGPLPNSEGSPGAAELEIPLKEDGSIDFGAMPSDARSKLLKALRDPVSRERLGLKEPRKAS